MPIVMTVMLTLIGDGKYITMTSARGQRKMIPASGAESEIVACLTTEKRIYVRVRDSAPTQPWRPRTIDIMCRVTQADFEEAQYNTGMRSFIQKGATS